ncbi:MAG: FixH family protein [Dissulfurispiraceae bacterium]
MGKERKGGTTRRARINRFVLMTLILLLAAVSSYAASYEVKKEVGGYIVVMKIDRNPPIAGDNNVSIEVTDAKTLCACQANVAIEYSRPAMPGMPPLHYTAQTEFKRGRHIGKVSLSMAGSWNIAVKITSGDKTWTMNFPVDVE